MGLLYWFCRCIPALSLICWVFVSYQALCGIWPSLLYTPPHPHAQWRLFGANAWELLYVVYSVAAHLCACVIFPARLCWSVWSLTGEVRRARAEAAEWARPYAESEVSAGSSGSSVGGASTLVDDKASLHSGLSASNAGYNGSVTPDTPLSRVGTPRLGNFEELAESVVHAIILPSYKEDMDTMRETLSVLASHILAKTSYDVSCLVQLPLQM